MNTATLAPNEILARAAAYADDLCLSRAEPKWRDLYVSKIEELSGVSHHDLAEAYANSLCADSGDPKWGDLFCAKLDELHRQALYGDGAATEEARKREALAIVTEGRKALAAWREVHEASLRATEQRLAELAAWASGTGDLPQWARDFGDATMDSWSEVDLSGVTGLEAQVVHHATWAAVGMAHCDPREAVVAGVDDMDLHPDTARAILGRCGAAGFRSEGGATTPDLSARGE